MKLQGDCCILVLGCFDSQKPAETVILACTACCLKCAELLPACKTFVGHVCHDVVPGSLSYMLLMPSCRTLSPNLLSCVRTMLYGVAGGLIQSRSPATRT